MFQFARKNIESLSDEELLARYKNKWDLEIVGILFDRYTHLIYGVCRKYLKDREESKDAVMQIFEKVIVELRNKDVRNFKSWLYVVTKNFCLMMIRKRKVIVDISEHHEKNEAFIMESQVEMSPIDENPDNMKLKECIEALSSEQKQCIQLFYYKEKCYKEISDITKYDIKKVKSYIQNGKRNLKNCMEK